MGLVASSLLIPLAAATAATTAALAAPLVHLSATALLAPLRVLGAGLLPTRRPVMPASVRAFLGLMPGLATVVADVVQRAVGAGVG